MKYFVASERDKQAEQTSKNDSNLDGHLSIANSRESLPCDDSRDDREANYCNEVEYGNDRHRVKTAQTVSASNVQFIDEFISPKAVSRLNDLSHASLRT